MINKYNVISPADIQEMGDYINNSSASTFQRTGAVTNFITPDSSYTSASEDNKSSDLLDYFNGLLSSVGNENAINRDFNHAEAELARQFSSLEAEKNRNWLADMSNTSYQRAVADLQKAGLNPILAFSHGGASTPSSSPAGSSSASYNVGGGDTLSSFINSFANLISSASDVLGLFSPLKKVKKTVVKGFGG